MVQGEKQSCMTTLASSTSRTSDPAARKASHDALQKMDQSNKWSTASKEPGAGASSSSFSASKKTEKDQYGSWGPMFQNKSTFASMHFC